jgi:uncharacterized membrane protein YphA (DoxX/SURF4 family)
MKRPILKNAQALGFLRIAIGTLFLIFAQYKILSSEFIHGGGFQYWIDLFIKEGAYPFMRPILQNFVLPHGIAIAYLATYGELAIAIALIAGIWVRVASVFGAIFMLTLIFSANYPGPDVPLWRYFGYSLEHSVFLLCFITFILGDAAEAVSLPNSRWWRSRTARSMTT